MKQVSNAFRNRLILTGSNMSDRQGGVKLQVCVPSGPVPPAEQTTGRWCSLTPEPRRGLRLLKWRKMRRNSGVSEERAETNTQSLLHLRVPVQTSSVNLRDGAQRNLH